MLAAAGLSFAACQKNVDVNKVKEGTAAVSVKVVNNGMATKAGATEELSWTKAHVKLTAVSGSFDEDVERTDLEAVEGYAITDVMTPSKLEVSINSGAASYTELTSFATIASANMPAYGSTTTFEGPTQGEGTLADYQVYKAKVTANIPVARMEVSGIKFKDEASPVFKNATLSHVYLDGAPITGVNVSAPFDASVTAVGMSASFDAFNSRAAQLAKTVEGNGKFIDNGVVKTDLTVPADGSFAFNFFPQGTGAGEDAVAAGLPQLVFHFTGVEMQAGTCADQQYVIVRNYKDGEGNIIKKFDSGKIYRIAGVELSSDKFIPDPTDDKKYAVDVTVTVEDWEVVNTTVEF